MSDSDDFEQLHVLARSPQHLISETNRFFILVLGCGAAMCASFSYAFNLVSPTMQIRYNLSQRDLSTISTVGLAVQYFVLPYAFIYDYIGPRPILVLAMIYFFLGTLLLALCFDEKISGSVVRLSVFNALMGLGCVMFDLACAMTVILHFPANKGAVTALIKTFTGLGSAMVGAVKLGFFENDIQGYFYFLMAFAIVVGVLGLFFMKLPGYFLNGYEHSHLTPAKKAKREERKAQYLRQQPPSPRLYFGFAIIVILIIFLPLQSALVAYRSLGRPYKIAFAAVTIFFSAVYLLIIVPFPFFRSPFEKAHRAEAARRAKGITTEEEEGGSATPAVSQDNHTEDEHDHAAAGGERAREGTTDAQHYKQQQEQHYLHHHIHHHAPYDHGPDAAEEQPHHAEDAPQARDELDEMVYSTQDQLSPDYPSKRGILAVQTEPAALDEELDVAIPETEVDYIAPQYQHSFLKNLRTLDLWMLWWTFFALVGTEFVVIFNATFLLGALGGQMPDAPRQTLLTVLNGVGSAVGRLIMSYIEARTQNVAPEKRIPITFTLFLPNVSVIISLILFVSLPYAALPLPYCTAALGNGFLAATTILVTRTMYAKDPAKHYNFCFTASMMSAIVLNRFLYGEWYSRQAEKYKQGNNCLKRQCVLMPLFTLLGISCTAFISTAVLHFRYRRFCQRILAERAHLRAMAQVKDTTMLHAEEQGDSC